MSHGIQSIVMPLDNDRGFSIEHHLAASPDRVFRAWTEPDQLSWFGNPDADHPTSVDLRVGGEWRIYLVQPDGERYWTGGTYREIVPDQRISFAWGVAEGWPELDPARPDDNPVLTVTLAAAPSGGTAQTVRVGFPETMAEHDVQQWLQIGIEAGWTDTVDRLVRHLE